jgi:hypothetical protein
MSALSVQERQRWGIHHVAQVDGLRQGTDDVSSSQVFSSASGIRLEYALQPVMDPRNIPYDPATETKFFSILYCIEQLYHSARLCREHKAHLLRVILYGR